MAMACDTRNSDARGPQNLAIQQQAVSDLRLTSKVSEYRDTHNVSNGKDVDHLLSCNVANTFIYSKKGSINQNEVDDFNTILNSSSNLRAVDSHTNRNTNKKLDNQINQAHSTGDYSQVNKAAIHRAQVTQNAIKSASNGYDNSFVNHAIKGLDNFIKNANSEYVE